MAPVKFDDLSKVAKSVLSDDYVNPKTCQFKAKQKADGVGGTVTTTVDLKDKTSTSVSWKLPSAFAIKGFNIDKFEYNKSGGLKFEAVIDKNLHKVDALTVDLKTDFSNPLNNFVKGVTYTGIKDTQVKFETKVLSPEAFTAEITREVSPAVVGVKVSGGTKVDVGARGTLSGLFSSLVVTDKFSTFEAMCQYKVNKNLEVAAMAKKDTKSVSALGGIKFTNNDMTVKAKVSDKGEATAALIYKAGKGLTVTGGAAFGNGKDLSYGVQLSVE